MKDSCNLISITTVDKSRIILQWYANRVAERTYDQIRNLLLKKPDFATVVVFQ